MTNVQLICERCGYKTKRPLLDQPGCRGTHETACQPALCPKGHGNLARVDGVLQQETPYGLVVTGYKEIK